MPVKQSICYPIMLPAEMPLETLVAEGAKLGYAAIELWGPGPDFPDVVALATRHGMIVASFCGMGGLDNGLNNPANHDRIEAELRASIDLAAAHGVPGVICFSGNRRPGLSDDEGIAHTAAGLRRVAPYAEARGVNLNLELLNSKVDHKGYQCDHTAWGVAVCEAVNSPNVKLLYDIYHMQIMEGDIIRTIRENIQWIGHFHTAGVPGRHDMDDTQELNYTAICRAISEAGYGGYVGHEFAPTGDVLPALARLFPLCHV
jgi:hydroxypyruvate isomerase